MKRIVAALLAVFFVVGALIVPTLHRMHCAGHHTAHEAAKCSICQFTGTPVIANAAHITPTVVSIIVGNVSLPQPFINSSSLRGAVQARAPPKT